MTTHSSRDTKDNERVQVVVRCRPINLKEVNSGYYNVVDVLPAISSIQIFNPKENEIEGKIFTFDAVYDCNSSQEDLYEESVKPVVTSVLDGFNGTIFAYGQTGTGKTFTMEGNHLDPLAKGIIPKSFEQIFNHISISNNIQYLVRASYIEIYQEEVKDLLDGNGKKCYELRGSGSNAYIKNLKSHLCKSAIEMEEIMKLGNKSRKVGSTDMNERSSRSHAIFIITIEMSKTILGIDHVRVGKLNLVDLAGSERQPKSCTSGERLKEASKINLSLSALGNVISALSNGKNFHVPYRDSKLTRLLQDSLGGNSKTLMIANIGPASYNYDESLTTLRYANRAKNIKNKPRINEDPKDTLIRQYQDEIKRLKALVKSKLSKKIANKLSEDVHDYIPRGYQSLQNKSSKGKIKLIKLEDITDQQLLIKETTESIEALKTRIKSMESRLLNGSDIKEHTSKQQIALFQQSEEIREQTKRQIELKHRLEKEEETTGELQETHSNLQLEIDKKTKKLNKFYWKLEMIREQTSDMVEEFNNDRKDLDLDQTNLIKKYKLNQLIIDNFIPADEREKFVANAYYNKERETWLTNYSSKSGLTERVFAANNQRRPESEYSRILAKLNLNARFKSENVIKLGLEHQNQEKVAYKPPKVSPTVKHQMEKALAREDDIIVDAACIKHNILLKCEREQKKQCCYELQNNENVYPKARGLVRK